MNIIKIVLNYIMRASEYDLAKKTCDVLYKALIETYDKIADLEHERDYLDGKVAEYEQQPPYQSYVDLVAENKRLREGLMEISQFETDAYASLSHFSLLQNAVNIAQQALNEVTK